MWIRKNRKYREGKAIAKNRGPKKITEEEKKQEIQRVPQRGDNTTIKNSVSGGKV